MIDVALAIDGEAKPVIIRREGQGTYDRGGRYVPGAVTETTIMAAVQPAVGGQPGGQLEDLPEGIRSEAKLRLWTRSQVKENEVVVYKGSSYRILAVFDWFDEGGFYDAVLGRQA